MYIYADSPSPPLNLRYCLNRNEARVDFEWEISFHAEQYFITISPPVESGSTFTTSNTTIQFPLSYNQEYNISIIASSCAGNSTPTTYTTEFNVNCPVYCSYPMTVGPNVSVEGYGSGLENSQISYYCQPGLVPSKRMVASCTSNGQWNPDPALLVCTGIF